MTPVPRAIVTGAGGFIGHHLVAALKADGYWVRGLDLKYPEFGTTAADEFELLDLRRWEQCETALRDARGAEVYIKSCATGYCHGVKGTAGGAPRLAIGADLLRKEHRTELAEDGIE